MSNEPPATVTQLSVTYTTQREMELMLSMLGVQNRISDDTDSIDDIIAEATTHFDFYLMPRYDANTLGKNQWVRRNCTWMALSLLSQRKGNPTQFQSRVDRINDELEKIRIGRHHIPRATTRANDTPMYKNLVVDHRRFVGGTSKITDAEEQRAFLGEW